MSGFREPGFADRQKAAQQAKQNLLNKFRAQPGHDDPEVAKRRAFSRLAAIVSRSRPSRRQSATRAMPHARSAAAKGRNDEALPLGVQGRAGPGLEASESELSGGAQFFFIILSSFFMLSFDIESLDIVSFDIVSFFMLSLDIVSFFIPSSLLILS